MRIVEPIVWAYEKVLRRLGRLNVAEYDAKHRISPAKMKAALAGRIQDVGIQKAEAPDPEAETVQINPGVVQAIASLREWKREEDAKTTPEVIEPVDADVMCDSTHAVEGDPNSYECEQTADGHDPEFCSAFGGEITWQREVVLEVAA